MNEEILAKFLGDRESLSDNEYIQLSETLKNDVALRKSLQQELVFEEFLSRSLSFDRRNFGAQMAQRLRDLEPQPKLKLQPREVRFPLGQQPLVRLRTTRQHRRDQTNSGVLALAACVALLLGAYFLLSKNSSLSVVYSSTVAKVESVAGKAEWARGEKRGEIKVGEEVSVDDTIEVAENGQVTLVYPDQSKIELRPRAKVAFRSQDNAREKIVFLKEGRLIAQISKQKAGAFALESPHALVKVIGTHFSLTQSADETQVAVKEGIVSLQRISDSAEIQVTEGQYVSMKENQPLESKALGPVMKELKLVSLGSEWKYLDNGSNQGTSWRESTFNDEIWVQGKAPLGYGHGGVATEVKSGPQNKKHITTYLRKSFSVSEVKNFRSIQAKFIRDDGVVVYVNGVEAFRSGMPSGEISSATSAAPRTSGGESTVYEASVNAELLRDGENILAVELHQSRGSSSDIFLDLELTASIEENPDFF
jgi:ferric-dicitrate binding protein FerR (iron transport regulator)